MARNSHATTSERSNASWLRAVAATGLLIAACLAAGASAQLDPGTDPGADTRFTPTPKETVAWAKVAGASWNKEEVDPLSATTIDTDLYATAFENQAHGFAGGSQCKEEKPGLTGTDLANHLRDCDRVPVIYEYQESPDGVGDWHVIFGGRDSESQLGYVGAIAFMRDGRALAVGGDGKYPKREPGIGEPDPAGNGRAWVYADKFWRELTPAEMRPGMRGMTAVAMSPRQRDCTPPTNDQCGLAGAYRQLWLWRDGRFVKGYTGGAPAGDPANSPVEDVDDPPSFRFRVRDILFHTTNKRSGAIPQPPWARAVAVTSGCCDPDVANSGPRLLWYDGAKVHVRSWQGQACVAPDSIFGLTSPSSSQSSVNNDVRFSMVTAGGGADGGDVPSIPSRVTNLLWQDNPPANGVPPLPTTCAGPRSGTPNTELSTMRLVAGDGTRLGGPNGGPDAFMDWAVGSLGGRGVAYFTPPLTPNPQFDVEVFDCPREPQLGLPDAILPSGPIQDAHPEKFPECTLLTPDETVRRSGSETLYEMPSYPLNDFVFSDQSESVGWAVGERGAIVRYGGVGSAAGAGLEQPPPKLGSGSSARFGGTDVYDAYRPLPTDAGTEPVPSLQSNGDEEQSPRLVSGGSPNPTNLEAPETVTSIVMSRDGGEGWAVGPGVHNNFVGNGALTAYHFDGMRWSKCDTAGMGRVLPPDPACAALEPLTGYGGDNANPGGVKLLMAARVPYENDSDSSNDDEFEVVAIGTPYKPPGLAAQKPVIVRYRDGQWAVDEDAMSALSSISDAAFLPHSIAFTAPDDGWLLYGAATTHLAHWDGESWTVDCTTEREVCEDPNGVLPLDDEAEIFGTRQLAVAGTRVYLATNRGAGGAGSLSATSTTQPVILYNDHADSNGKWRSDGGGLDPGCAVRDTDNSCAAQPGTPQGKLTALAVGHGDNGYVGWVTGAFGTSFERTNATDKSDATRGALGTDSLLMRLEGNEWSAWEADDAAAEYLTQPDALDQRLPPRIAIVDGSDGDALMTSPSPNRARRLLLRFDAARERWRVARTPFLQRNQGNAAAHMLPRDVVSDGRGGAWFAAAPAFTHQQGDGKIYRDPTYFWRWTDRRPKPVFKEAPHPIREEITGGTAGADGSFWVTTNSSALYRYDRLTGWDKLRVPGWDPGRLVTRASEANAVAVGPDGQGVVVGKSGRMAQLTPESARLDPAAGRACSDGTPAPCGSSHDLHAVAVAPDGSALAGGDASTLLFRPGNAEFRSIPLPGGSGATTITAISYPRADQAWVATDDGRVFSGTRSGNSWSFSVENLDPAGFLLSAGPGNRPLAVQALQIDSDGEGYAVGDRGLILERRGADGWQRLKTGFLDNLTSVALAPNGRGHGAIVGGQLGLILTLEDGEFRVAREADLLDPVNFGDGSTSSASVVGLAIVPGSEPGDMEAWAVQQVPTEGNARGQGPGTVLHYTNAPDDPLMNPGQRVKPIPDTPEPRAGEISFAAFGRSDCHTRVVVCPEFHNENLVNEVIAKRIVDEISERSTRPGGPKFALFTGDVGRAAGREGSADEVAAGSRLSSPVDRSTVHRRWVDFVAEPLIESGVPLFGALGPKDLNRTATNGSGVGADAHAQADETGLALPWRQAMAGMPAPWGTAPETSGGGFSFSEVQSEEGTDQEAPGGGARTHYAADICSDKGCPARLIVVDNSLDSVAGSEADQNPIHPRGGQVAWLEDVLTKADEKKQQKIVVMSAPTYTYGPGATDTTADATAIETILMRHKASVVVSGRLGWNGRYWATAAGLHEPCPGGAYMQDTEAPRGPRDCAGQTEQLPDPNSVAAEALAQAASGLSAPPAPGADVGEAPADLNHVIPFVVASSAGGTFGPDRSDDGPASDGFWHGYTIVRLDASGDTAKTIVEQRPVFDWLSITAPSHVLKPGQKMALRGEGREPVGTDEPARYDRIDSPAITHRYDLVLADPEKPGLPRTDADGGYTAAPASVGTIDRQSGVIKAGRGRQERTFAIAILSVGDKAASWPVAFEPSKSFTPRAAKASSSTTRLPGAARIPAQPNPPAPRVLSQPPSAPPPSPPPPPPVSPTIKPLNFPQLPSLGGLPGTPTGTATPVPPPPPPPPPPPSTGDALPLTLEAPVTPVSIVPTVIPPTPPPINPAPPAGGAAKKEARQRQAAAAKSEEGGGEGSANESQSGSDGGGESSFTRHDRTKPAPSITALPRGRREDYHFTAVSHAEEASPWSRAAFYGGMTAVTALVLATGWGIMRPTPKRKHPPRPAPGVVRQEPWRRRN
jgi:hypothetical protein